MEKEVDSKIFLIAIVAILALILLVNNFSGMIAANVGSRIIKRCNLNEDCNLQEGNIADLDGKQVELGAVMPDDAIMVSVDGDRLIVIQKGETEIINGLEITNKFVYYKYRSKNNYAILFIILYQEKELNYKGILEMLQNCDNYLAHIGKSCKDECNSIGLYCLIADFGALPGFGSPLGHTSIEDCDTVFGESNAASVECLCCSVP